MTGMTNAMTGTTIFKDDAVKAATRAAFDSPTQANLESLITAVRAECSAERDQLRAERDAAGLGEHNALAKVAELQAVVDRLPNYQALFDIGEERMRQVEIEGWTPEHDDKHVNGELVDAAACYVLADKEYIENGCGPERMWVFRMNLWPWDKSWWKPTTKRRNLCKAGALIVAEMEREARAAALATQSANEGGGK